MNNRTFATLMGAAALTLAAIAPFDLPAMHIYKIWGGQIHEIEAIGFQAPLNSATGWE